MIALQSCYFYKKKINLVYLGDSRFKTCATINDIEAVMQNAGDRLIVLSFYANWCDRCKSMNPKVETIANTSPNVIFLKVDVDVNKEAVEEYDVESGDFENPRLPTFIFMKNHQRLDEMLGETNVTKLKELVEKHGEFVRYIYFHYF